MNLIGYRNYTESTRYTFCLLVWFLSVLLMSVIEMAQAETEQEKKKSVRSHNLKTVLLTNSLDW